MTTIQLIILIVITVCAGIKIGILISNFNRNRFLTKHGISPSKFDSAIEEVLIPTEIDGQYNIKTNNK